MKSHRPAATAVAFTRGELGRAVELRTLVRIVASAAALLMFSLPPSEALAQGARCWICEPRVLLEPAAFARNIDADRGDIDLLLRVHIMAPTAVSRLGVSAVMQWVVSHGSSPMVMAHLSYTVWRRPLSVAPFLGVMNLRFRGQSIIRPMTALYVTVPTGSPYLRFYALGTLVFADDVVPSLALGLRVPFAPLPGKGAM